MSHSHTCCLVHVVFATAERRPMIRQDIQEVLHRYMGGIARENGISALAIGAPLTTSTCCFPCRGTVSVAKAVQLLKSGSSKWLHENFPKLKSFAWQEGYGAFSIGVSQRAATVKYIESQAEHHKRISSEEEFKKFLAVHEIEE